MLGQVMESQDYRKIIEVLQKYRGLNRYHMIIVGSVTRVFSKENVLLTRVKLDEKKIWDGMINEVKKYVAANAPQVMTRFNEINKVNTNLFTALERNYKENIFNTVPPFHAPSIEKTVDRFNLKKELRDIQKIKKKLEKKPFFFKETKKTEATRFLLYILSIYIEECVNKVLNDLNRLKK